MTFSCTNIIQNNFLPSISHTHNKPPLPLTIKLLAQQKQFYWSPARQQLVLEALSKKHFSSCESHLKIICQRLDPSHLHLLIKASLNSLSPKSPYPEPFNRLKQILSLEQIEAAIRTEHPSFEKAINKAKEMSSYAKYYLELTNPPTLKPLLNNLVHNAIWALETTIDSLLSIFGFYQMGKDSEGGADAHFRLEATLALIAAVSTCITVAVTVTGSALLGMTLVGAGIATLSALLALYFKFVKPAPRSINGLQNFTAQAAAGKIDPSEGRQRYIDQLAETLIASRSKPKVHPLLIGPSGVGKTEIMKAFANAVAQGRYPELKGMQVFYINTADLIAGRGSAFESPPTLEKIKERIQYRPDKVILIFDEIHQASKEGAMNSGNLGEKLKTLLDDGEENFPYVIAATTDEEYAKHILLNNDALARRFKQIPIQEMNRGQTIAILNKIILKQTGFRVTQEAIEAAYDLSNKHFLERPQPYMACRILSQAISKVKSKNNSDLPIQIDNIRSEIEKNLSTRLLKPGMGLWDTDETQQNLSNEYTRLESTLAHLKELQKQDRLKTKEQNKLLDKLEANKQIICQLAKQIDEGQRKGPPKKLQPVLKEFALLSQYVYKAWEDSFQNHIVQSNQNSMQIDVALIQQIVEQEVALKEQRLEMLKKVKKQKKSTQKVS